MTRALLASPLGFVVGLSLGTLGSGGSILAVPMLVHVAGQTPQEATATSLLLVGAATLAGLPAHFRASRVKIVPGLAFGAAGIGGSFAGTALNRHIDPGILLLAFSGLILIAAWRMLTACPTCTRTGEAVALATEGTTDGLSSVGIARGLMVLAAGTAIGFLTGLFGVGGGFVIVPALTLLLGFAMPQAIGTSLLVVAINSVVALLGRLGSAHINGTVAAAFIVAAAAGAVAGGQVADRINAERSLRAFATLLVLLALFTAGSAVATLR